MNRDFGCENVLPNSVRRAAIREVEAIHRPRHADVGEAALFFELRLVGQRARMREDAFFETGQEHDRELEALGERASSSSVTNDDFGIERVEIADQRDVGQEVFERTCRFPGSLRTLGNADEFCACSRRGRGLRSYRRPAVRAGSPTLPSPR